MILDSSVERARVRVCQIGWQGATRRGAAPRNEEQHRQAAWQARNRARSGLTHAVSAIEGANVNIQAASRGKMSGQLGNQG